MNHTKLPGDERFHNLRAANYDRPFVDMNRPMPPAPLTKMEAVLLAAIVCGLIAMLGLFGAYMGLQWSGRLS